MNPPIYTHTAGDKRHQWGPTYGEKWPTETIYPDTVIGDGESGARELALEPRAAVA